MCLIGFVSLDPLLLFYYLIGAPNLKFLSSAVPEIWRQSQNLKVGHVTQAMYLFDPILHFLDITPCDQCIPNLKFLASAIPEIWRQSQNL